MHWFKWSFSHVTLESLGDFFLVLLSKVEALLSALPEDATSEFAGLFSFPTL